MRVEKISNRRQRLLVLFFVAIAIGLGLLLTLNKPLVFQPESLPAHSRVRQAIPGSGDSKQQLQLFYASKDGRHLQAEERRIETADTLSAVEAIISALIEGPTEPGLVSTIPAGTQLKHSFLTEDGTAYLDFTPELATQHPGGVTAERLTLHAIVNSLVLNLDAVNCVQILLDGEPAPTLSGHLDILHPTTADLLIIR